MNLSLNFCTYILLFLSINAFAQNDKGLKVINGKEVMLHKVLSKETWTGIARTYNLSIDDVKSVNPGIADLKEGQIINVPLMPSLPSVKESASNKPSPAVTSATPVVNNVSSNLPLNNGEKSSASKHTVKEKETLFGIAKKYGVKVDDLKKWNANIVTVKIGQVINVKNPYGKKQEENLKIDTDRKEILANAVESKVEVKSDVKDKPAPVKAETIKTQNAVVQKEKAEAKADQNVEVKPAIIEKAETKISSATVLDNDQKNSSKKSEVKSNNGSVVREYNETGMAAWIKDGSLNQNKYYALHRTAPLGTIVKVNNRMNGDYVFVKVVGQLPDSGDNDKQIIKISEAAARKIGAVNEHFQVELSYGVLN